VKNIHSNTAKLQQYTIHDYISDGLNSFGNWMQPVKLGKTKNQKSMPATLTTPFTIPHVFNSN